MAYRQTSDEHVRPLHLPKKRYDLDQRPFEFRHFRLMRANKARIR
jgi:hypothetical protein